jgi:two-component system KDP operon response regulator KdpE
MQSEPLRESLSDKRAAKCDHAFIYPRLKLTEFAENTDLTKPFGVGELLARIRAALRRTLQEIPEPVFISNDLQVDLSGRRVTLNGADVALTPTEYDILRLLVSHAGKVMTHTQILKQIWGIAYLEQPHVLRVNISNLRRKIETDPSRPRHIITEPGVGYRLT